jgi:pimeloyl-ACP methyl ester carboxylesterase
MLNNLLTAIYAALLLAPSALAFAQVRSSKALKSGCAPVNGLNLCYQVHGSADKEPLILLHGGLGAGEMFNDLLPSFTMTRQVITVDLQAHGRTADIDRPLSLEAMADDIAALLKHLGIAKADVMGYSLGGGVALCTAIQHPQMIGKLVLVSTAFKRDGWYPEIRAAMSQMNPAMAEQMKQSPMYQIYWRLAPRPTDWPLLVNKVGELVKQEYDFSKGVATLKMPVLLVYGDADAVRPEHMVEFFQLLGGGKKDAGWDGSGMSSTARLAILPGLTHYNVFAAPSLVSTVRTFLEAPDKSL